MIIFWYLAVALVAGAIFLAIFGLEGVAFSLILGAIAAFGIALAGGGRR